jgi:hypothetical protein
VLFSEGLTIDISIAWPAGFSGSNTPAARAEPLADKSSLFDAGPFGFSLFVAPRRFCTAAAQQDGKNHGKEIVKSGDSLANVAGVPASRFFTARKLYRSAGAQRCQRDVRPVLLPARMSKMPCGSTVRSWPGKTTLVEPNSSTIAGPVNVKPAGKDAREKIGVSRKPPSK